MVVDSEEWRSVSEYEGWYSVSDHGRVRRDRPGRRTRAGRILKVTVNPRGYAVVGLTMGSHASLRILHVHKLVAEAFIGPCPDGGGINHRNGVKTDNALTNLEWASPAANSAHAVATGLMPSGERSSRRLYASSYPRGERHPQSKLTEDAVRDILSSSLTQDAMAAKYGVSQRTISVIRQRKTWRHIAMDSTAQN